jgi:hypothetical protein
MATEQTTISSCCITGRECFRLRDLRYSASNSVSLSALSLYKRIRRYSRPGGGDGKADGPDLHSGTPAGSFQQLHGLNTYVSPPAGDNKTKTGTTNTIVILHDIYGPGYVNTQLVADEWAKQGWKVVVPDCFEGDPVPVEHIRVSADRDSRGKEILRIPSQMLPAAGQLARL